ncbi:membrane protein [Pseudothermotoga hypogea DSM 11164 = NBRC 106472]|uniref:Membrane protein n=2 Tax=Thermotogaceae TaxID=188709 RepID=A0A0X1KRP9_9THEM|nr:membrane protein [Pseudothermotoga hypogea DSM 11164 = NBRC 106472]
MKKDQRILLKMQKAEMTEYIVYTKLAKMDKKNSEVLSKIAKDELSHYKKLKILTQIDVAPSWWRVIFYLFLAKLLGITFALKLMEQNEEKAQKSYKALEQTEILSDEEEHEKALLKLIDEERIEYIGSMVLGLNDALVELTGALAGLTLAIRNSKIVALSGIITGLAAALSMSASDYLSRKSEGGNKKPLRSALYTGIAYLITVLFLVFPYMVLDRPMVSLYWTIANAVLVILIFTFFVSVVKEENFKKNFLEMLSISMGVAVISFFIGMVARRFFNIEV